VIAQRTPPFDLAEVRVDTALRTISGPFGTFQVEPRAMDVLMMLARRAPDPVSRDELIDSVWGGAVVTDGVLTRCISILRERLGDERGRSRFIETLSKHGYRLVSPVALDDAARTSAGHAPPAPKDEPAAVPIAVMPFTNLAGDLADDHVVDGLTELLIANLAGVAALRVIARTSSMTYKHTSKRVREIAAELGVDYVVEGSVLGEGSRIQVVVQLIEARSEMHAWVQTYAREVRDALTLLNEVAKAIAHALSVRLREESARFRPRARGTR
jgi:TolB-like protein